MRARVLLGFGLAVLPSGVLAVGENVNAGAGAVSPEVYPTPQGRGTGPWAIPYAQARALVAQMTLEEMVNITRGFPDEDNTCAGNTGSVPRLGWQGLCLMDAGNGVRATDMVSAWPSGLHAGASWDRNLTYERGLWMAREFRAKGVNIALGPNAGPLGRTPLGGRNWEGFSVDPYLSGQLNAKTIVGMQTAGVMANLKVFLTLCNQSNPSLEPSAEVGWHFIANEQETYRRPYFGIEAASSNIDDKTLHEYYLWPFMDGVRAGAASVMCSYNRVNNTYACDNSKLLNGVLKGELAFEGFVMLDWNAQHTLQSASAGLDMLMPGGGSWGENLTEAVRNGTVEEKRVTDMATRILAAWYLVGQDKDFPPPGIGMKNLTQPHEPIDARDLRSKPILMEGARAGHVLVKNERKALPLKKLRMVSVFGYDATVPATKNTDKLFELGYMSSKEMGQAVLGREYRFDQAARGGTIVAGGRAGTNAPAYISDPLSAIQQRAQRDNTWVNWDLSSPDPEVNAASQACLVFINAMATEGWDRQGLHDDFSDALVLNVAAKCTNTVVVIHAAGIRLVDSWIEHPNVTAAVLAHLPGQDSGAALVSLLWGDANFSGKLPYTLARNESDYPVYAPCGRGRGNTTNPQCDYAEGVYLDYRAFDARNMTPRYEFGFGLSYTTFSYSDLIVELTAVRSPCESNSLLPSSFNGTDVWDMVATVQAKVRNSGPVAGDEIAQLYVGIPGAPPKQLRGFDKVSLAPGQDAVVRFELTRRDLSEWHVGRQRWVLQEGDYTVFVGASSRDIRLEGVITVKDE